MSRSLLCFLSAALLCFFDASLARAAERNSEKVFRVDDITCGTFMPPPRPSGINELNIVLTLWMDGYATAALDLPILDFDEEKMRENFSYLDTLQTECVRHREKLLFPVWKYEIIQAHRSLSEPPLICEDFLDKDEREERCSDKKRGTATKEFRVWLSGYVAWKAGDREFVWQEHEETLHRICLKSPGMRLSDAVYAAAHAK